MATMRLKIEKYLEQFPRKATCWSQATDEIRDLARESREHLKEFDNVIVEPINFQAIKTPAEWNTKGRKYILTNFDRMQERTQTAFYNRFREWFE